MIQKVKMPKFGLLKYIINNKVGCLHMTIKLPKSSNRNPFGHVLHQNVFILTFKVLTSNSLTSSVIPTAQVKICLLVQHLKMKIMLSMYTFSVGNLSSTTQKRFQPVYAIP